MNWSFVVDEGGEDTEKKWRDSNGTQLIQMEPCRWGSLTSKSFMQNLNILFWLFVFLNHEHADRFAWRNHPGGGGTHMLRHTGMCCILGQFFEVIPKHGSHFAWKKSLTIGWLSKFSGVHYANPRKSWNFRALLWQKRKNGDLFPEKSLNISIYFWKNYLWKWVWVTSASLTNPNLRPPNHTGTQESLDLKNS